MKTTIEKVKELKKVNEIKNILYTSELGEIGICICSIIKDCSTSFCKDIAEKALNGVNLSEKQTWCLSYEFIKIQHCIDAWVEAKKQ